jgi:hypothetical protein
LNSSFGKYILKGLGKSSSQLFPLLSLGAQGSADVFMLLDSGADLSLIPYSAGEAIGLELDMENRSEVQGIGEGSIPYILSEVKIEIGVVEASVRIGWALIEEIPLILGRLDVFQQFSVEFREFEDKIILNHQSEFVENMQG